MWSYLPSCIEGQQQQSIPYGQCYRHFEEADADQNGVLAQEEFADGIRRYTYGAVDLPYASLGAALQAVFTNTATPVTLSERTQLDGLCEAMLEGILENLGISITSQKCFVFITIGDSPERDDVLVKQEFLRYANAVSGSLYATTKTFEALPLPVQLVFDDFSNPTTQGIDVTGTKPGSQASSDQYPKMISLCRQTFVAVAAGEMRIGGATGRGACRGIGSGRRLRRRGRNGQRGLLGGGP